MPSPPNCTSPRPCTHSRLLSFHMLDTHQQIIFIFSFIFKIYLESKPPQLLPSLLICVIETPLVLISLFFTVDPSQLFLSIHCRLWKCRLDHLTLDLNSRCALSCAEWSASSEKDFKGPPTLPLWPSQPSPACPWPTLLHRHGFLLFLKCA